MQRIDYDSTSYSNLKNIRILISLLKKYGVKHIVLSPGGRNVPFVHSVENDKDFSCYSIVDERSAAFFAIGMIQYLKEPVAICCTSATAVCNYMSAVEEAFYQHLPLIVLTADRNSYYLNQDEDQMIPQTNIYRDVCKKEVTLPIVKDETDEWHCARLVNEALSELNHDTAGPVHINFQVEKVGEGYSTEPLPNVTKIERVMCNSSDTLWSRMRTELREKRILLIFGQQLYVSKELVELLNKFTEQFDCTIAADYLSNLHCDKMINTFTISNTNSFESMNELLPDIVITMGGNYVSEIRGWLKRNVGNFKHWKVSQRGDFADQFRNLTCVFECSAEHFLTQMLITGQPSSKRSYFDKWKTALEHVIIPDLPYSSMYAVSKFLPRIPANSKLHLANSNSVRIAQMFELDKSVEVFCNRGCNGIDGSLSAFVGQANIASEVCFLLVGDLSFFYDMNGLWNRYINSNMRILLNNNEGAGIFHVSPGKKLLPTINAYTAAEHNASAEEWVKSRGFNYISSHTKVEFDKGLDVFVDPDTEGPIFFEVFTDKETDAKVMSDFYNESKRRNLFAGDKSTLIKGIFRRVSK